MIFAGKLNVRMIIASLRHAGRASPKNWRRTYSASALDAELDCPGKP